ncbi:hypothetical protein [Borrelia sp. RT1S]|uniref:hypothetical protein n=1 Tax=Borrelia sp. RT1S TaxID=2898580 RepID=UPI001E4B66E0|nr:hypothetical protein [Borrelia sp. RT1S]UGQ17935.1 hypothetical protein LSO05_05745 [Borrelia sp. RT1S]
MNIKIVSISILILFILFIGCKDRKDKDGLGYDEKELEAFVAKLSDEVSKAGGFEHIKVLSQTDINKVTEAAKISARKTFDEIDQNREYRNKSNLIDQIRLSTQRFDFALNSLKASGLSNAIVEPLLDNITHALRGISVVSKLTDILENNEYTLDDVKEAFKALDEDMDDFFITTAEIQGASTYGPQNITNTCVQRIMESIDSDFAKGVRDLLGNVRIPYKFRDSIENLQASAHFMSNSVSILKHIYR